MGKRVTDVTILMVTNNENRDMGSKSSWNSEFRSIDEQVDGVVSYKELVGGNRKANEASKRHHSGERGFNGLMFAKKHRVD